MAVHLWRVPPKWTDTSVFCRPPDEFGQNAVDRPIHTAQAHQLYIHEKLVSSEHRYSHTKAAWF